MPPRKRTARPALTPAQVAANRFAARERQAQIRAHERQLGPTPTERVEAGRRQQQAQAQQVMQRRAARRQRAVRGARRVGGAAMAARVPGTRSYQPVILAEFVAAVVVVALLPVARPPADGKAGASPYRVGDLRKLAALMGVFFILAIASSGRTSGRVAAWFGGLVVVGLLLNEAVKGNLTAEFKTLSGVSAPEQPPGTVLA